MKRKINIIGLTLFFTLTLFSFVFSEESVTITTYYPSPYGSYNELTTTGNTYLATASGSIVGIGTSSPNARLDVTGFTATYDTYGFGVRNSNGIYSLVVRDDGNVGIGTASPGWLLHVNGSAAKPGGGSWTDSSDIRLKKNVKPIENALEKILGLRGVKFEWKEQSRAKLFPGVQIGMVAQDVEKVFPQWVSADKDGYKDLTFRGFEALTVEAIRELKAENDALKAKIEVLESKLNAR